jgi:hypothetical protein
MCWCRQIRQNSTTHTILSVRSTTEKSIPASLANDKSNLSNETHHWSTKELYQPCIVLIALTKLENKPTAELTIHYNQQWGLTNSKRRLLDTRCTQNLNVCSNLGHAVKLWLYIYKNVYKTIRRDRLLLKIRIYSLKGNRSVFDTNSAFHSGGYEFEYYLEPGYRTFWVVFLSLIIKIIGYRLKIPHDSLLPRHSQFIKGKAIPLQALTGP